MYQKILVALDGSPCSWRALAAALEIARHSGAELHAITVEEGPGRRPENDGEEEGNEGAGEIRLSGDLVMEARHRGMALGVDVFAKSVVGHEIRTILTGQRRGGSTLLWLAGRGIRRSSQIRREARPRC